MPKSRCIIAFEEGRYFLILEDDEYRTEDPELFVLMRRDKNKGFETLDKAIEHAETEWGFKRDQIFIQLSVY